MRDGWCGGEVNVLDALNVDKMADVEVLAMVLGRVQPLVTKIGHQISQIRALCRFERYRHLERHSIGRYQFIITVGDLSVNC